MASAAKRLHVQNLGLARALHDGLLQNLVFLDMELASLKGENTQGHVMSDVLLDTLRATVTASIADLRGTLGRLRTGAPALPVGKDTDAIRPGYSESLQELLKRRVDVFRDRSDAPFSSNPRSSSRSSASRPRQRVKSTSSSGKPFSTPTIMAIPGASE